MFWTSKQSYILKGANVSTSKIAIRWLRNEGKATPRVRWPPHLLSYWQRRGGYHAILNVHNSRWSEKSLYCKRLNKQIDFSPLTFLSDQFWACFSNMFRFLPASALVTPLNWPIKNLLNVSSTNNSLYVQPCKLELCTACLCNMKQLWAFLGNMEQLWALLGNVKQLWACLCVIWNSWALCCAQQRLLESRLWIYNR